MNLRGKRAIVTGGSRGVGAATALLLARYGADVAIGYRANASRAATVAGSIAAMGVKGSAHPGDLATEDGAARFFGSALESLGGLDIFVGNAGIWPSDESDVASMDFARWRETLRQNLDSIFHTTKLALRAIRANGRVVLVSSTAGQRGEALHADYAASKGAVISFVKSVAVEVAPAGTTVNCVAPGWIDTEMVDAVRRDGSLTHIASAIPLKRVATADDIAGPIVFLCSDLARHITGEVLNVNGGSVLCG